MSRFVWCSKHSAKAHSLVPPPSRGILCHMTEPAAFIDVNKASVEYQTSPPLTRLLGVNKKTIPALNNVNFQLPQGSHIVLFGAEASGKSTLLRLLTGVIKPAHGSVTINGKPAHEHRNLAAGYISSEESEPAKDTVHTVLGTFARTHAVPDATTKIGHIIDVLALGNAIHSEARFLSSAQRLKLNIARAALSETPLVLLDDVADQLGVEVTNNILEHLFPGRTVIVATRFTHTVDALELPMMLLHRGTLTHYGTIDEIALNTSTPRLIDVWVEGLRYDLLRQLKSASGVLEAKLIPTSNFSGQKLRVTLHSSRYLPSVYDLLSQAPLIKVEELPPSLNDVISRL